MDNQEIDERYKGELRWQRGGKWRTAAAALLILAALGVGVYFLFLAGGKGRSGKTGSRDPGGVKEAERRRGKTAGPGSKVCPRRSTPGSTTATPWPGNWGPNFPATGSSRWFSRRMT